LKLTIVQKKITRGQRRLIRTRARDLARVRAELLFIQFCKQLTRDAETATISIEEIYSWHPPSWLEPAEAQPQS